MINKLDTQNISLDTAFFEEQNFLVGSKIAELSSLTLKYSVKLYMTDITYREILSRFHKNLLRTDEEIKKPTGLLISKARLLKNFSEMDPFFQLPIINVEILFTKFSTKFDLWIRDNNVTIIRTDHLTIKEVFDDYFNNNPPFKEGKKKYEFPDAFTLKGIVDFFKKRQEKTYLISSDKDILEYKEETIFPIDTKSTAEFFDLIIQSAPESMKRTARELVKSEFESNKNQLLAKIKDEVVKVIEDKINSIAYYRELEIDEMKDLDIFDLNCINSSIPYLDIDTLEARIECEVSFKFDVSFYADDYSQGVYDKEDDRWYFVNSTTFSVEGEQIIPVEIGVSFDLNDEYVDFEIESINNGQDIDVFCEDLDCY